MPHAASITPPSAPVLAAPPAPSGAQGKTASSAMKFVELFREQAGTPHPSVSPAAQATPKSSEELSAETPGAKPQVAPAAKDTGQPETEPGRTEPKEPASPGAPLASSKPVGSLAASPNQLHPAVNGANANGAKPSKTLPEAAAIPSAPAESTTKSKKTGPTFALTSLSPQHKTNQDNQAGGQSPETKSPSSAGQPALPIVPVVAPAAKPTTALAQEQAAAAPGKYQWIRSVNNPSSTVAGETPLQSATPASHVPPAQAEEAQQSIESQLAPTATPSASKNTIDPAKGSAPLSAGASAEADSSKDLPGSFSPALHSSLVPHAAHTADQGTGAIAAFASAAAPVQATTSSPALLAAVTGTTPIATAPSPAPGAASSPALSPYDRIDQGGVPLVLHSGLQHVAVGVRDPELGWVEIETQNIAGHVDATLVTASGQTHASLAAQLPAMAQYLEQSDIRLGTLAVHHQTLGAMENSGSGNGAGYGSGDGSGNRPNHGSGYESGSSESSTQNFNHAGPGDSAQYNGVSPGFYAGPISNDEAPAFRPVSYISVRV